MLKMEHPFPCQCTQSAMINAENGNPYSTLFAIGKKMYQMLLVFGFVGVFLDCLFLFFFPGERSSYF